MMAQPSRAAVPRGRSAPLTSQSPSTSGVEDKAARSSQRVAEPRRYPNPENATTRVAVPRGSVVLALFGVAQEVAFAYALLAHAGQFIPVTSVGLFFALKNGFYPEVARKPSVS